MPAGTAGPQATITIDVSAEGPSSDAWLRARRGASRRMLVANSVIWALLVVALFAACAVTVFWVTWLRAFEFHRAYPKREDHDPPDIFRRPLR